MINSRELFIGLDLGGTNIKAGVVSRDGKLLGRLHISTGRGSDVVIANLIKAAQSAVKRSKISMNAIAAVGIASPGPLSTAAGIVYRSANLPGWSNVHLRDRIASALGKPATLENDAKAAAYGEYWAGVGRNKSVRSMVMLTLGTGVGGGIIVNGRLVHGATESAAEIGHTIIVPGGDPCGCGQRGCLEVYTSAHRTGERAVARLKADDAPSSLRAVLKKHGTVSARDVAEHASAGDKLARELWDAMCRYLGIGCVNITHMIDPDMIVLAGGMAAAGNQLLRPVRRHFAKQYWRMTPPQVTITLPSLGGDAGIIGAAGVAIQQWQAVHHD